MEDITELYRSLDQIKSCGLVLNEQQLAHIKKVEEDFVKERILPTLETAVEPILSKIQRELVFVLDYIPEEGLTVSLSQKRRLIFHDELRGAPKPRQQGFTKISGHNKAKKTILSVKLPDGRIISEYYAYQTLALVVMEIGIEVVRKLGIYCNGVPFISYKKDEYYNQYELKTGTYLMTHSSTQYKKNQLEEISRMTNFPLKVDIVYP